ncbi:asparaginase domain-containing protein [Moraxella canis]|uniref:Asparaginase domain-containing protein n=1 Tax=Moraxella canis TaxID=90239 RepID=A0ABZ0WZ51_9GAMM|nr:asparaginase domain-containing protein [Moraxella canis]WQE04327.1 asparaginase domain-containing protein [Moraxella canis]
MTPTPSPICLIYAGGTFGSHGTPLSPLPAKIFLPTLGDLLGAADHHVQILDNQIIKDSSFMTPSDFVGFYELILTAYQDGYRNFVLITGTDTLSFLAAFLARAFDELTDLSLVITGSMQPLLLPQQAELSINYDSDAWDNLSESITVAAKHQGVFVQFFHHTFDAKNTQKIHSQAHHAFVGSEAIFNEQSLPSIDTTTRLHQLPSLIERAKSVKIRSVYVLPNDPDALADALLAAADACAVILIGYGAGNLPKSQAIIDALAELTDRGIAIICTTMCAYGGTSAQYAAGAWQYDHGVWASGSWTIPAIYGQILWLSVSQKLTAQHWKYL